MGSKRTMAVLGLGLAMWLAPGLADAKGRNGHHAVVPVTTMAKARVFGMSPDPGRTAAVLAAVREHEAGPHPAGWEAMVARIRAEPNFVSRLVLVDGYVDKLIKYRDRGAEPWARSPAEAVHVGGLCRDYAVAKILLLSEAGVPGRDIRVVTVAPNLNHLHYHVLVAVKNQLNKNIYLLDMSKYDQARGPRAVEINTIDDTTDRSPVATVGPSGWEPLQQASLDDEVAEGRRNRLITIQDEERVK